MPDLVVTLPLNFTWPGARGRKGLAAWLMEGDPAGEPESGAEYGFTVGSAVPDVQRGDRIYVVHNKHLIGYAPLWLVSVRSGTSPRRTSLIRRGRAMAVTIDERIPGFRGWRYRWWDRSLERPIVNWPDIVAAARANEPLPPFLMCPYRASALDSQGSSPKRTASRKDSP